MQDLVPDFLPLSRDALAARVAQDIPEGFYVNLGIGIPTAVADYVPADREVIFHSENGVLGFGPKPASQAHRDRWLINAGKTEVTLRAGGCFVHHADSFAMIRGGHLDLCVLGAYEVSEQGDLANWSVSDSEAAPAVGGAMDLATGAKNVWVVTNHNTRDGGSKLVRRCTYPLTAHSAVTRIYTDLAIIDVTASGFEVIEMVPGLDFATLQARTDAPLRLASAISEAVRK